jgi:hypothetical protein
MAMTPAQAKTAVQDALMDLYKQGMQVTTLRVNWSVAQPATTPPLKCAVEFDAKL